MSDFGGWPLFVDEDETQDDLVGASNPEDWPMMSEDLKRDLVSWNLKVLKAYHLSGAESQRADIELIRDGKHLALRAQDELGAGYAVEYFSL